MPLPKIEGMLTWEQSGVWCDEFFNELSKINPAALGISSLTLYGMCMDFIRQRGAKYPRERTWLEACLRQFQAEIYYYKAMP